MNNMQVKAKLWMYYCLRNGTLKYGHRWNMWFGEITLQNQKGTQNDYLDPYFTGRLLAELQQSNYLILLILNGRGGRIWIYAKFLTLLLPISVTPLPCETYSLVNIWSTLWRKHPWLSLALTPNNSFRNINISFWYYLCCWLTWYYPMLLLYPHIKNS